MGFIAVYIKHIIGFYFLHFQNFLAHNQIFKVKFYLLEQAFQNF